MPILNGPEAETAISRYLRKCRRARIAVAYWGEGATRRLGLANVAERGADIEIICDLMSGSCNPYVIRELRDLFGDDHVLTRTKLHAKVWITNVGAVLGSSNASANGLGHEGAETERLVEANLEIGSSDASEIQAWERWYQTQVKKGAAPVTDAMLKAAIPRWRSRRRYRDPAAPGSLLDKMRENPDYFRDKPFVVSIFEHSDATRKAERAFQKEREDRGLKNIDFYEGWRQRPATFILDFDWKPISKTAKLYRLCQTLGESPYRRLKGTSILLVKPVRAFEGLTISRTERRALNDAATSLFKRTPRAPDNSLTLPASKLATRLATLREWDS
jgi:hypothetical protein